MTRTGTPHPHVVLLVATLRGLAVLRRLTALVPGVRLTVFSFPETGSEPRYLDAIRDAAQRHGGRFTESRNPTEGPGAGVWREPIDAAFLVHWRSRIPAEALGEARTRAFVFHDSLLPEYRGFSPTVWAIANGESRCGATLFRLTDEIDAGPIVGQRAVEIGSEATIGEVFERVTAAYLEILEDRLPQILEGRVDARAQDPARATYTCRRAEEDNHVDWSRPTRNVHNLIRAVTHPYPGAYSFARERRITLWSARPCPNPRRYVGGVPGSVVEVRSDGVVILTADGSMLVETAQADGGPEVPAAEILTNLSIRLR